jgi:hypothetical protein
LVPIWEPVENRVFRIHEVPIWELVDSSAVGFAAIADGGDLDGVLSFGIEEHPVVATAEAKVRSRRLEFFHTTGAISSHYQWFERGRPRIGSSIRYRYTAQIAQDEATSGGCFVPNTPKTPD